MNIAVYGLGYVGLTAAVCLAKQGHQIFGIDVSAAKVAQINAGVAPFVEPGLEDLLADANVRGMRVSTADTAPGLDACDIAIVCVGTPSGADGAHNMSYIAEVSRQIAAAIDQKRPKPLTVIYRSTVRPGTTEDLVRPIFASVLGQDFGRLCELVYHPEFLRETTAIKDFFQPPKIVVGTEDGRPNPHILELNKGIEAPVFHTRWREAEITKFVDNTFHALKVAFGNELGRICQSLNLDVELVYKIFVADTKLNISSHYLRPGGAFGGSCLAKDLRALQHISTEIGANTHIIDAVLRSNEAHKHYILQQCTRDLPAKARVLLVGLAFKANSDDLRESPNLHLARRLIEAGHRLSVYDPNLRPEMLKGQNLGYAYTHLPSLNDLLIDREEAERSHYDLVIEAASFAKTLQLSSDRCLNIAKMD